MDAVRLVLALAWKALRLEITLYRALGRWLVRRPDVPAGTTHLGYSRLDRRPSRCRTARRP